MSGVHVPEMGGAGGSLVPFGSFAAQVPELHHWAAPQSASVEHENPQLPFTQNGPAWVGPRQSALVPHWPQAPPAVQYVLLGCVQGRVLCTPRSDVQPPQVPVCVLQIGVVPVQAPAFVPEHCTHWFVAGSQAGVAPLHPESFAHGSHLPVLAPEAMHAPDRH